MNTVAYLKQIYDFGEPIFVDRIRIGRKSKNAIKEDLYRATKKGLIYRKRKGVYYFKSDREFDPGITFEQILESRYIKDDLGLPGFEEINRYGYITGFAFLNMIGLTNQVPMQIDIVTNNIKSKKRTIRNGMQVAVIRKAKEIINNTNWRAFQFFDMFYILTVEDIKRNREFLIDYMKKNISSFMFSHCLQLYGDKIADKMTAGGITIYEYTRR